MFYVSILGWSFFILSCLRFLCTFIHSLQKILDVIFHYYFSSFTNGLNNLQSGSLTHLTLHTYTHSQKKKNVPFSSFYNSCRYLRLENVKYLGAVKGEARLAQLQYISILSLAFCITYPFMP